MDTEPARPELLGTGVPNLDEILGGGIAARSSVMLLGASGTGKSILAMQIAFHQARAGKGVLYLTGYSETHDKLVSHNASLAFYVHSLVGSQLTFASIPGLLRTGATETEDALVQMARDRDLALVVVDGFRSIRGFLPS